MSYRVKGIPCREGANKQDVIYVGTRADEAHALGLADELNRLESLRGRKPYYTYEAEPLSEATHPPKKEWTA